MAKSKIITKLTKARDTKGTYVYKTDDPSAAVSSLYVRKSAIEGEAPPTINLIIEEA